MTPTPPSPGTYLGVSGRYPLVRAVVLIIRVGGVSLDEVNVPRDYERKHLFTGPERLGFEYGRVGHLAVPRGEPHQQVHHGLLVGGDKKIKTKKNVLKINKVHTKYTITH